MSLEVRLLIFVNRHFVMCMSYYFTICSNYSTVWICRRKRNRIRSYGENSTELRMWWAFRKFHVTRDIFRFLSFMGLECEPSGTHTPLFPSLPCPLPDALDLSLAATSVLSFYLSLFLFSIFSLTLTLSSSATTGVETEKQPCFATLASTATTTQLTTLSYLYPRTHNCGQNCGKPSNRIEELRHRTRCSTNSWCYSNLGKDRESSKPFFYWLFGMSSLCVLMMNWYRDNSRRLFSHFPKEPKIFAGHFRPTPAPARDHDGIFLFLASFISFWFLNHWKWLSFEPKMELGKFLGQTSPDLTFFYVESDRCNPWAQTGLLDSIPKKKRPKI